MERHLAVVENGVVTKKLVVDPNDTATIAQLGGRLLPEGSPVCIGWTDDGTTFSPPVIVLTPEEEAKKAQQEVDAAALTQAKADATVRYLTTHTPQECYDKVMADVTNLAQAKEMMGRMAMALSAIARKQLR